MIDAFRLIYPQRAMMGLEVRQTTSNIGHLQKPSLVALVHGLNRHYYSIAINYTARTEGVWMCETELSFGDMLHEMVTTLVVCANSNRCS